MFSSRFIVLMKTISSKLFRRKKKPLAPWWVHTTRQLAVTSYEGALESFNNSSSLLLDRKQSALASLQNSSSHIFVLNKSYKFALV